MIWRVLVGTVAIVVGMLTLGYVAITEQDRMASFSTSYEARNIEAGASVYEAQCVTCHGDHGQGGRGPALNEVALFDGTRTSEIGWTGTVHDFIYLTIAGGRPRPSEFYASLGNANRMPTFSNRFGGPLREDEVLAVTAFVMNWGEAYKDANGQFPQATPTPNPNAAGTDITIELPAGDATRGETLVSSVGCTACHVGPAAGVVAPAWLTAESKTGTGIAVDAEARWQEADYSGSATSTDQYLFESIVHPNAFIVPPSEGATWPAGGPSAMPANYGTTLLKQDMADIIAYLKTVP